MLFLLWVAVATGCVSPNLFNPSHRFQHLLGESPDTPKPTVGFNLSSMYWICCRVCLVVYVLKKCPSHLNLLASNPACFQDSPGLNRSFAHKLSSIFSPADRYRDSYTASTLSFSKTNLLRCFFKLIFLYIAKQPWSIGALGILKVCQFLNSRSFKSVELRGGAFKDQTYFCSTLHRRIIALRSGESEGHVNTSGLFLKPFSIYFYRVAGRIILLKEASAASARLPSSYSAR